MGSSRGHIQAQKKQKLKEMIEKRPIKQEQRMKEHATLFVKGTK